MGEMVEKSDEAAIQEKVPQHPDDLEWESSEEEDQPLTTKNKQSRKRKSKASEAPSQKIKVKDKGKQKITLSEQILLKKHNQPNLMQDAMQSSLKIENLDTSANRGCNPLRTSIAEQDDEENKKDDFFEILKNWSSGPSLERKLVESSSQDLEDKLSAFRQQAYVNNLDEALNDPNFKLEIEKVVNDLNNISDLPSKVSTELQDFVRILTSDSKLRLKTLGIKEEINKIEINTSKDRNKLLQMK
ncbi:hypothetical protein Fmac_014186 [Flemingia macrophylla]|uniref:Uncharacterized protein n=1 Tax=Flemingia macrophylla TaxID=520843 RepID=A0ABD1MBR7_9FABA